LASFWFPALKSRPSSPSERIVTIGLKLPHFALKFIFLPRKGKADRPCFNSEGDQTKSLHNKFEIKTKCKDMKTLKLVSLYLVAGVALCILLSSCESNPDVTPQQDILPQSFTVDIPASLTYSNASSGRLGRSKEDSLRGNDIYLHLGTFISVGEGASEIVNGIIAGLRKYRIDRVLSMTYVSEDDNRAKNLIVTSNVSFESRTWDYQLTITDADSESNSDGGKALQIFWNKTAPITGIAIIKPYNCDRIENAHAQDALFRIDYSENSNLGYDAQMEVLISGLPLESPLNNPYSMSTLRMFAGKKGDVVDVYGNSNHPNAILFSGNAGFNWAFVASGDDTKDIGVAEVGLPPSTLESDSREVLLEEYSIRNVFTHEITTVWPGIDPQVLGLYLKSTAAPGYFNNGGFISGGASPGAAWDALASRLADLKPYTPKEVSGLTLTFN
jgi:hypothetical protein